MIGLGAIAKLAKGGMSLEDVGGILQAAGIDLRMSPVDGGSAARAEFGALATDAAGAGAKLLRIEGQMKDGSRIHALLIMYL